MKIRRIRKILLWTLVGLVAFSFIVPALLYVPFIQDAVKSIAVEQVSKATGWQVEVENVRLQFPLDVKVNGVVITENGDTIIAAGSLVAGVKLRPLFSGMVKVDEVLLDDAIYRMTSADSSLLLAARVQSINVAGADYDLATGDIAVGEAALRGGDVRLDLYNDKAQPTPPDTTASTPFKITVGKVSLSDLRYTMTMMPIIDSLGVEISSASLQGAAIDMGTQCIDAGTLAVDSLYGTYLTPTLEYLAAHPVAADTVVVETAETMPWTVRCAAVRLTRSGGVYAVRDAVPVEGLDMNYLAASNVNLSIDSLYNCGTAITVPIKEFTADERSGLRVTEGSGTFAMDDNGMTLNDFNISTLLSSLYADGYISNAFLEGKDTGTARLVAKASIGLAEVGRAMPDLNEYLSMIPQHRPLEASLAIDGTARRMEIGECNIELPRYAQMGVYGMVENVMSPDNIALDMAIDGNFENVNFIKPTMLEAEQQETIYFPPLLLGGEVQMRGEDIKGNIELSMPTGRLALDAYWAGRTTDYDLTLRADSLPLRALLPLSDFGVLTAGAAVQGHGIDVYDPATEITAHINVDNFEYAGEDFSNVIADAALRGGIFNLNMSSDNHVLQAVMNARGSIKPDIYDIKMDADIGKIDLYRIGMSETAMHGHLKMACDGMVDLTQSLYDAKLGVKDLGWTLDEDYYYADAIDLDFKSDSLHTQGAIVNGDLSMTLQSPYSLDSLLTRFTQTSELVAEQIERVAIDADTLRDMLPELDFNLKVGKKNLASQFLQSSGVTFGDMNFKVIKDSTFRMTGDIDRLTASGLTIDTVKMYATERNRRISYLLRAGNRDNRNGTGIKEAGLLGLVAGNRVTVLMRQKNFSDSLGVRFGIDATLDTTSVLLKLIPEDPIIGYKRWYVNEDNQVSFNYLTKHFDANVKLQCDSSIVSLLTHHHEHQEEGGEEHEQEDILLNISKVQISDWLTFSPLAPPMRGVLGVDLKVKYNGENLWGDGVISLDDFYYAKKRVGDFTINSLIDLDPQTGATNVTAALEVDHRQALIAYGSVNDTTTTSAYNMWLELDRFPLSIVNPFMPPNVLKTYGYINGMMTVSGLDGNPLLDGYLQCDSTYIAMPVFSTNINLPSTQIPVDSSIIRFDKYSIKMLNDNPLVVNGTVDVNDLADAGIDLALKGQNVQFVNSNQTRKAELFGRGFANLDATVKGKVSDLDVDATVSVLSGTNITYVMPTDVNTLTQQSDAEGLVTFVQFSDSTSYVKMDSLQAATTSNMNLRTRLNIMQGSQINVFLNNNGTDRAELQGSGNLTFVMNRLGDMTMTGRYTINDGFVRYNPPLISQVLFDIDEGSYIQFNGEIMNPVLNLRAVQTMKASVTQEGQNSRLVDFLISLAVTNTLNDMGVQFDLSTNSDVTVQNELQSMSETQRSNQAMNMLLYGVYTGPSTSSSSNLATNQLYSFLQSKLNSWAASNIKGIDLSFGIDQYDQTVDGVTSSAMRYSYQVSKSLFNDRFKIVVGGNYSPDMTADDEIAQSLFNDVSLQYSLTQSGSMYVRLFNKSGYESILEGEVTQTGVGFVISRKLPKLKYLFRFRRPRIPTPEENTQKNADGEAVLPRTEVNDTTETTIEK